MSCIRMFFYFTFKTDGRRRPYNSLTRRMVSIKLKTIQGREFSVDGVELSQTVRSSIIM